MTLIISSQYISLLGRGTHHLQKHCQRPRSPSNEEWPGERHKELKALT